MSAKPAVRESRERLLADPRVLRWYKNRGTRSTSDSYLANLELFMRRNDLSVDLLLKLARGQRNGSGEDGHFADTILRWVETERKAGRPDSYLATVWASVRSFLKSQEAAPSWVPNLKVRSATTIMNEVVPTPEQLRAVLDRNPVVRTRAAILVLATTGIRPGVIGSRTSPNGLRLRDLPDLDLGTLSFSRVPFQVVVPAELSKGGSSYFSFGTEETANALVAYLKLRVERGEKLTPSCALFAPEPKTPHVHLRTDVDGTAFLSEKGFSQEVRLALRRAKPTGVRWRPYVLRSFASSQFMLAENAGLLSRDYREFFMGHTADIAKKYNVAKGRVRGDIADQMREAYAAASSRFFRILTLSELANDSRPGLRVILSVVGYTKKEIDAMGELTEEIAREKALAKLDEGRKVDAPSPGDKPRTVSLSELDLYLEKGWRPIAPAGERFVVGAPN
ncbi:MAG: hypothetical protein ABSA63_05645 [Thermoplasmata archaeon]|jgi:integrase